MGVSKDKVVIVGGSSGVGRAAALSFAEHGAKVVVTGRRAARLEAAATHSNIVPLVADAAAPDAARTVAKAAESWGGLDVLAYNAGAGAILPLAGATAERALATNSVETEDPLVLVVDDDEAVRTSLQELMQSVGISVIAFASTRELLEAKLPERPGCLVLDVRMPGTSGLDLQERLVLSGNAKPIIFVTGHADIPMTVKAMKAGAVDFLTKPVRDQTLLDAVAAGIQRDIVQRAKARAVRQHVDRFATLTPRERQVLREVALGRLNKQIAFDLGISEVTVKLHRGNVMRKLQVVSVGQLVKLWELLPAELRNKCDA